MKLLGNKLITNKTVSHTTVAQKTMWDYLRDSASLKMFAFRNDAVAQGSKSKQCDQ